MMILRKCFITIALIICFVVKNEYKANAGFYQPDYQYNVFAMDTWIVSPYIFGGYALSYSSHKNQDGGNNADGVYYGMDYQYMLRNYHHGFKAGVGFIINKNWSFEVSYSYHTRKSTMRGKYTTGFYANIKEIKATIMLFNIDFYVRLPFTFDRSRFNLYITGGMDIIHSYIEKAYRDTVNSVPLWLAKLENKTSFGLNAGIAIDYNITQYVYVRTDARRLFVLSSSLIKNSWIFSATLGFRFL